MRYYGKNMLGSVRTDNENTYMTNPYSSGFDKVNTPEGESGDWKVQRFEVTKDAVALYNLRLIRDGRRDRVVPVGTYTRLVNNGDVVMSDTPAESHEHRYAYRLARGNVLVNGLGLGFFLQAILRKTGDDVVTKVTVIENSPDVIKLVGSAFADDPRVTIICADAFEWQPPKGEKYDFVWHDIWPAIDTDNKPEMTWLRRKYARRTQYQRCWAQEYI